PGELDAGATDVLGQRRSPGYLLLHALDEGAIVCYLSESFEQLVQRIEAVDLPETLNEAIANASAWNVRGKLGEWCKNLYGVCVKADESMWIVFATSLASSVDMGGNET
ncbi:hypothetical protein LTS01_025888, partial [Friedmanniomyces endolithicus]